MTLKATPFIMLDGEAAEAIRFYEEAIGAKVSFKQKFGESPGGDKLSEPARSRVAHSVLKIGDGDLFVADISPEFPHEKGNQVNICLTTTDAAESKRLYEALRQGGNADLPLKEVHFSPAYGVVTDRFGVTFQIFTARPR